MELHGDEDPVWPYEGGGAEDLVGVEETMVGTPDNPGWARVNGCSLDAEVELLEDTADDGTQVHQAQYGTCDGGVEVVTIEGGGHTWPQGHQWLGEDMVGRTSQDFAANDMIWAFLSRNPRP